MSGDISGPSIKDALSGKVDDNTISAKQQHAIYTNSDESEDFSEEELKLKWDAFVGRFGDRPNLQSTLSGVPRLTEDYNLVLDIENSVQDDLINSVKPELVSWLRRELRNSKIQLSTNIIRATKEKIIYTDTEKLTEMVKKNPLIDKLRQKFKLDFE